MDKINASSQRELKEKTVQLDPHFYQFPHNSEEVAHDFQEPISDFEPTVPVTEIHSNELEKQLPDFEPTIPVNEMPALAQAMGNALHSEEVLRAKTWSIVVGLLSIGVGCFLPFFDGNPIAKMICGVVLVNCFVVSIWVWFRLKTEANYTKQVYRIFGWSCVLAIWPILYFCGPFSPVSVAIALGINFFGLGKDRIYALLIPLVAISGYTLLLVLTSFGVLPNEGVIATVQPGFASRIFILIMIPFSLLATLYIARRSRLTMAMAIRRSNEAVLLAQMREEQALEARQDLEKALHIGQNRQGQYSGSTAGDYNILNLIGRGAMGEVYLSKNQTTGNLLAVKMLHAGGMANENAIPRFIREGELASSIQSPHIIKVLDVGQTQANIPFIAMELLTGEDLATRLRRCGNLQLDEVVFLVDHIAKGLKTAHQAGLIHRDLKPQNIFRSVDNQNNPTWKILDFGVAKLMNSSGTLTQKGILGTPGYMAPEQARGKTSDPLCDIFSLGAVTYRALTGKPPFSAPGMPQILFKVVYEQPIAPSKIIKSLPPHIDMVLAIALAKDKTKRFQNVDEFVSALQSAVQNKLSPELIQRAQTLLEKLPWSQAA